MAAAPTVVPKSPAICGSSESVTRTWAWLAKPATASSTIDRVGFGWVSGEGVEFTGGDSRFGRQPARSEPPHELRPLTVCRLTRFLPREQVKPKRQ